MICLSKNLHFCKEIGESPFILFYFLMRGESPFRFIQWKFNSFSKSFKAQEAKTQKMHQIRIVNELNSCGKALLTFVQIRVD